MNRKNVEGTTHDLFLDITITFAWSWRLGRHSNQRFPNITQERYHLSQFGQRFWIGDSDEVCAVYPLYTNL
jgi:hypothetical protein